MAVCYNRPRGGSKPAGHVAYRVCALVCSAVLLISCAFFPGSFARAQSTDDLEGQIDTYQRQIDEREKEMERLRQDKSKQEEYILTLQKQANDLESQMAAYQQRVDEIQDEIDELDGKIEALAGSIDQLQSEMERQQGQIDATYAKLRERLRAVYMSGQVSSLEFFLSATDISDYLSRIEIWSRVSRSDKALIRSLTDQIESLKKNQEKLAQDKASLDQQKGDLEARRAEQQVTLNGLQANKSDIVKKKQELDGYVEGLDKNSATLLALQEEDRKRQEAAQDTLEQIIRDNAAQNPGTPSEPESPSNPGDSGGSENPGNPGDSGGSENPGDPDDSGSSGNNGPISSSGFCWPLPQLIPYDRVPGEIGYLSSHYSDGRPHPVYGDIRPHSGVDLTGSRALGRNIVAVKSGTVIFSGTLTGYGYCLLIDHGNGLVTLYGHCDSLIAKKGQKVRQGEIVAIVGNSGVSTGPHLHFEVRDAKGNRLNPEPYLPYDVPSLPPR